MDEHQRRLQRAAPGDRAARARVLQDRLRRGELSPERVALLAYLGDHAARDVDPAAPRPPETLEAWVEGLRAWGREPLLRALAAAARATLPTAEAERPCPTCGHFGQVQVRVGDAFEWEPCPSCAGCDTCHGARTIGDEDRPCPACTDLSGRTLVEELEAWVAAGSPGILVERALRRLPTLLLQHAFEDPSRPARTALLSAVLDMSISGAAREQVGDLLVLGSAVAARVVELDRAAEPRGCVGDAIVDALHAWASESWPATDDA